ncbi:hypothetical protein [Streptomyces cellulosae]|uniref:hypothetical protein n=1 Tax=Streptomyces cellulosae TaxID=1968 RepID=UPI0006914E57|nr:hypothetical protein [Streptomyces cellulosae]
MSLSAPTALHLVEALAASGVVISCLEQLARPQALKDSFLAGWPVLRLSHPRYAAGLAGTVLTPVASYPGILWLITARASAAACLIPAPLHGLPHAALLAVVVATTLAMTARRTYGGEGSDQLVKIIFCTLLLAAARPTPTTMQLALWFLAAQAALAYFSAGIHKATSRTWWDGSALTGVLTTRTFGNQRLAAWLTTHPTTARWLSRSVGPAETLFPLVLVAPPTWLPVFLALGAGFHLSCAIVMGLDCFLWAFTALYPAIAYTVLS